MSKKARDLLPPDGPEPVRPEDVRPADDDLEVEVETRKIGIRRVSSLDFADKLTARTRWRPAGNSRRFWRQIEADDPFKKRPARPTDAPLEMYPAQRIERVEGSLPKPQPEVAKATSVPRRSSGDRPQRPPRPVREQPRERPERVEPPQPVHTPDPRTAQAPQAQSEPAPEPIPPQPQGQHRRLPPKPPNQTRTRSGRQRMPSRAGAQQVYGKGGKTAAEIREQKRRQREAGSTQEVEHPIKKRSLDALRETMKNLMFHQEAFESGEEDLPELPHIDELDGGGPRKPKGEVKRGRAPTPKGEVARKGQPVASTAPRPAPKPVRPPPIDRTPPKPKKADAPIDRSPSGAAGGNRGGLDDLFGGGGDRVRIGRRAKKTDAATEDDEEG